MQNFRLFHIFILCSAYSFFLSAESDSFEDQKTKKIYCRRSKKSCGKVKNVFTTVAKEIIGINYNLLSWDSLKIIATVFPMFVGARMIDEDLQNCFYDWDKHKNRNCPPGWCHEVARNAIAIPLTIFSLQVLFGQDEAFRQTNITMLIGMPFVIFGKDIIKSMRFDACLRPWHEKFGCEERSSGGFPSGHAAEVTYMAFLYGMRYGPKFALPLGALAVGVGATFLTCNRHYLSQLIAGAGLGALYAFAANAFIDTKLNKNLAFGMSVDEIGLPSFKVSYSF